LPGDPEPHQRQRVVEPFTQRRGGIGPGAIELGGEQFESLASEVVVGERPRAADPNEDLWAVALGQQIGDIPFLVPIMATSP
jgi:hypothetical protein